MTLHMRDPSLHHVPEAPYLAAAPLPRSVYARFGKRPFDLCCLAVLALPALCVILPLAWLIARDGHAPFFRQERLGRDGARFQMWKLRSMVPDAEQRLATLLTSNPEAKAEWSRAQKLRHDPRITRLGRFIRKTSIDELPQLLNVLRGEMSMIGPRPMMETQRALYPGTAYFALRPGITGHWQTSARNAAQFSERARYDTAYLRDMSLGTDLVITLRTIWVVLRGTGC